MIQIIILATALVALLAGPAHAGPVVAVIGWIGGVLGGTGIAAALMRIGIGIAASLLSQAIAKKLQKKPEIDVQFEVAVGDDTPLSFVMGDFATAGKRKYVGSWGPNTRYITEVIEVSCLPQPGQPAIWVNDEPGDVIWAETENYSDRVVTGHEDVLVNVGGSEGYTEMQRRPVYSPRTFVLGHPLSNYQNGGRRIWLKWIDGSQSEADPLLLTAFGDDPDYPWTETMIGTGKSYAIITTQYDRDTLTSYPQYLIQPPPLPVYDPRLDSTAGGDGPQRWGDRATYAPSRNNAVIAYNIARGIYFGSEWIFGGRNLPAWRLPMAEWIAAMNACDDPVDLAEGGTEPAFRCGLEIRADMEPLDIIEEVGRAANMRFAEVGGMIKPVVGLPGASVFSITDGDIIITEGQSLRPFAPVAETFNAISATYPEPREKWASKDAPEYIDAAATAADGGRYLPTSVSFPASPYAEQVQRLMRAQLQDYRRDGIHQFSLPPDAYGLEPLDVVTWDSARNGYAAKKFVVEKIAKLPGLNVSVALREVEPGDYDWSPAMQMPVQITPPVIVPPWILEVRDFVAAPATITDAEDQARRPGIRITVAGGEVGVTEIRIRIYRAGEDDPEFELTRAYAAPWSWVITEGLLPATDYEVSVGLISEIGDITWWTDREPVTTPDVRLTADDLADGVTEDITAAVLAVAEEGWEAAQTAAETAASNAIAAQSMAVTARDQAQAAFAAADTAADEALTSASDAAASASAAGSSASAASGSASTAASHADAAGASATAAAGSATTASTQAGNASTSASQAATSATNAQGSANSAATSASVAASSRDAADDAASAAATSASSAATAATNADSRASAAQTSATNAATSAGAASTSASQAATSASNASGSANSASTSAGVAAEVRDASTRRVAAVFPSNFELDGTFWVFGHNQSATVPPTSWGPWGFRDTPAGRAVWIEGGQSGSRYIVPFGVLKPLAYQTFRVTVRARVVGAVDPMTRLRVDIVGMNADLSSAAGFSHQFFALTNDWQDLVYTYTMPATPRVIYRPRAGIDTAFPAGAQLEMVSYLVEEITSEVNAQGFATAAANSASAASASQTAAGASASAAASSATTASTGASNAATSALSASGSATSAAGSSAQALEYRNASARMTGGGVSRNPVFNDWTGTVPANTGIMLGGTTTFNKATSGVRYVNAVELVGNDVSQNRPILRLHSLTHSLDCVPSPERILVRAEIELVSGSLNGGAALAVTWASTGGTNVNTANLLSAFMVAETGRVQTVEVYLERPAGYAPGTNPHIVLDIYAVSNIHGSTRAPCTLRIHRFDFEVVTANSQTEIIQRAKVAVDGIQSSVIGLRSKAGSAGALLELVSLSDPNGASASAARLVADDILLDGTVKGKHFDVETITADKIVVGTLTRAQSARGAFTETFLLQEAVAFTGATTWNVWTAIGTLDFELPNTALDMPDHIVIRPDLGGKWPRWFNVSGTVSIAFVYRFRIRIRRGASIVYTSDWGETPFWEFVASTDRMLVVTYGAVAPNLTLYLVPGSGAVNAQPGDEVLIDAEYLRTASTGTSWNMRVESETLDARVEVYYR